MKKILFLMMITTIITLSGCSINKTTTSKDNNKTHSYIAITAINGSEIYSGTKGDSFGCDDKIAIIQIPKTNDIKKILSTMLKYHPIDPQKGYYNIFENSNNIQTQDITLEKDSIAIVNLSGELYIGGMCDTPRVSKQIQETLKSNNYANNTKIYINGEDINYYLSEQDEHDMSDNMNWDNTENIIKNINQIVAHINNNLGNYQKSEQEIIDESSEGGNSIYYKDISSSPQDTLYRKITAEYYGEMGKSIFTFYFDIEGSLIYISQDEYDYNMPIYMEGFDDSLTIIQKNKYYFHNNKLIKREINDPDGTQNIDPNSDEFKEKESYLIKYSQELSETH